MKLLLILISAGLATVLFLQWRDWPPSLPSTAATSTVDAAEVLGDAPEAPAVPTMPPPEAYAAIAERPLFLPGRRPIEDEPQDVGENLEEEVVELTQLDVTAILMLSSENASVWIKQPGTPELIRLRPGDAFKGWRVAEIKPDHIVMARQDRRETLNLMEFSQPKTAPGHLPRRLGLPPNRPHRPPQ
jgi:hypothetical protein